MKSQVSRHNTKLLNSETVDQVDPCVCTEFECPLNGLCESKNVVYQATISSDDGRVENYIGCTKYFKKRYYGHRSDMNNPANKDKNRSTLANYVWKLKDERKNFDIKWKIIDRGPLYNPLTKKCRLCIKEKYYIIMKPHMATLNKRSELYNTCRHRLTDLLSKSK